MPGTSSGSGTDTATRSGVFPAVFAESQTSPRAADGRIEGQALVPCWRRAVAPAPYLELREFCHASPLLPLHRLPYSIRSDCMQTRSVEYLLGTEHLHRIDAKDPDCGDEHSRGARNPA